MNTKQTPKIPIMDEGLEALLDELQNRLGQHVAEIKSGKLKPADYLRSRKEFNALLKQARSRLKLERERIRYARLLKRAKGLAELALQNAASGGAR
jgi:uncharacterized protein YifE (UPF0438 family)